MKAKSSKLVSLCFAFAVGISLLSVAACSRQIALSEAGPAPPAGEATFVGRNHFVIYGLGQTARFNAGEICGGAEKVAAIDTQETFLDGVLGSLTLGLYAPRTYRVHCK